MYKINNEYVISVAHRGDEYYNYYKYFVDYFYSENELIEFLAKGYILIHFLSIQKIKKVITTLDFIILIKIIIIELFAHLHMKKMRGNFI